MFKNIKNTSKILLRGNTAKLFLASAFSFLFRYGLIFLQAASLYLFLKSPFSTELKASYGNGIFDAALTALSLLITFILLLLFFALKEGESYVYFLAATKKSFSFTKLFTFFKYPLFLKVFENHFVVFTTRLLWACFFCVGVVVYFLTTAPLIKSNELPTELVLLCYLGGAIVFAVSFVMWRLTCLRYKCAHIFLFKENTIKKSILITDKLLKGRLVFGYSFVGWVLCCFFIFPIIYVVPYIKLSNTIFSLACLKNYVEATSTYK